MDNITESEQPKPERIVKLGEEFPLLDPQRTTSTHKKDYSEFKSNVILTRG